MDIRQFDRAEQHREQCTRKIDQLRMAENFVAAVSLWSEFLVEHQRWFTRMQQAFAKGPSSAWFGKLKGLRKVDPLLLYLHEARHADEHGLEAISEGVLGAVRIGVGSGPKYIHKMRIENGLINIEGWHDGGPIKSDFVSAHLKLNAVENRGVVYQPPRYHDEHSGGAAANATALQAGEQALAFMSEKAAEGKTYLERFRSEG